MNFKKFISLMGLCLIVSISLHAQKASLTGTVTSNSDHLMLPGATLKLKPGNQYTYSDEHGQFTFLGVKPGNYTLEVSYIGYGTYNQSISLEDDKTANVTVELSVDSSSSMRGVIVTGTRLQGQSKALNQQKNNYNITNIVSADQVGRFPDANIGDAMKRIPGITMQNDQGEARNIIIRGLAPELNSVTLNGDRIPSAEGDNRRVQMDLIPSDMIQTIEVNKTLLPNMDADAIGGSVNLITRAASNGMRISGSLSGGINPIRSKGIYSGSFVLSNRYANNKLGVLLNGSINSNMYGSDDVEAIWSKDKKTNKTYTSDVQLRRYEEWRIRRSIGATIDYKIDSKNTIYLSGLYNWRDDRENRYRLRYQNITPVYNSDETAIDDYTARVVKQTKGGIDNGRVKSRRLEDQRMRNIALRGDHLIGNTLKMDWSVAYSKSSEKRPNERYIGFESNPVAGNRNGLPIDLDFSNTRQPFASYDLPDANFTRLNELVQQNSYTYETEFTPKIDFRVPLTLVKDQKGRLSFGGKLRIKSKDRNNDFYDYTPTSAFKPNLANLGLVPLFNANLNNFYPNNRYGSTLGNFASPRYLGQLDLDNTANFTKAANEDEFVGGNYHAKERITAAYLMLNQDLTEDLSLVAGARLEHTHLDYTGNVFDEEYSSIVQKQSKNNFNNILPDVMLKYNITNDFILRAAWTNSIARPNYYDLVPYVNIVNGDNQILVGNPDLKPTKASNWDLMLENYFKNIGIVSGGVFYKKLNDFIYNYRDQNFTAEKFAADFPGMTNPISGTDVWSYRKPMNGNTVDVYGAEVSFQRQLNFLPGFLKYLGLYTNYTYTHSKAKGVYNADGEERTGLSLPGTAPHMFNFSLSYDTKKFVARISANYTAGYLDEVGDDAFNDSYYDKQFFLDANASYMFAKGLRFFVEANNLTNQPLRYYQGYAQYTKQMEYYGAKFNFGLKFDLSRSK